MKRELDCARSINATVPIHRVMEYAFDGDQISLIDAVDDHMSPMVEAAIVVRIVDLGPKTWIVRDQLEHIFERITILLRLRHPEFQDTI